MIGRPSDMITIFLQIVGTGLLLWGTLFVRGWEIQTWNGKTIVEKVNRWIYRIMYCLGTGIIVCSLIWSSIDDIINRLTKN